MTKKLKQKKRKEKIYLTLTPEVKKRAIKKFGQRRVSKKVEELLRETLKMECYPDDTPTEPVVLDVLPASRVTST